MKHYDYIEWILYKSKGLSEEKYKEMEEHLYLCDDCMEIFLSLIDEEEIIQAANIVPKNFNEEILNKIGNTRTIKLPKKNPLFNYQFGTYVAIASLTIFLTMGGYFNNLVDAVPKISLELEINMEKERPNKLYGFSKKIVNKTSKLISSIENLDDWEIRRKEDEK